MLPAIPKISDLSIPKSLFIVIKKQRIAVMRCF